MLYRGLNVSERYSCMCIAYKQSYIIQTHNMIQNNQRVYKTNNIIQKTCTTYMKCTTLYKIHNMIQWTQHDATNTTWCNEHNMIQRHNWKHDTHNHNMIQHTRDTQTTHNMIQHTTYHVVRNTQHDTTELNCYAHANHAVVHCSVIWLIVSNCWYHRLIEWIIVNVNVKCKCNWYYLMARPSRWSHAIELTLFLWHMPDGCSIDPGPSSWMNLTCLIRPTGCRPTGWISSNSWSGLKLLYKILLTQFLHKAICIPRELRRGPNNCINSMNLEYMNVRIN